jgi:uncharacterized protein (TIGR04255 family)
MSERPPYPNAPIAEAVLDIQCSLGEGVTVDAFAAMQTAESARYPHKQKLEAIKAQFQAQFHDKPEEPFAASAQRTLSGFRSASGDGLQVFHATINGFLFSRLRPYEGWEAFSSEARRLWTSYRTAATPASIARVAIRTINRLEFPAPIADPGEYLRTMPTIGEGVGKSIDGYFMQVVVPQPDIEGVAVITEAIDQPSSADRVAIILDIDLWRTVNLPQDDVALWELLDRMRHKKDDIFEACITDKTREAFQA